MSDEFGAWLAGITKVLERDGVSDVPCGECTACCRASQFVEVGSEELETLDRIPHALLFPAPNAPVGHRVMGYDDRGHCPMFVAIAVRSWTFTYESDADRRSHQRLGAVAASMRDEAGSVPGSTAIHIAIAAIARFVASESEPGRDFAHAAT